ncbi:putative membrane protein [Burkholderia oklahomensis]|uniref:Membrane protein n=1 Tax=Burkholderia oklahomensis TaxID=342113 RepID=A0AAI8BDN1_9BURK|nr:putative membrane protein [Burkholderia oklahomensis]
MARVIAAIFCLAYIALALSVPALIVLALVKYVFS